MKVIVTGGSGYLGIHVRRFFDADDFSRRSGFDILEPSDLQVLYDYDVVIHLAAHLDKDPAADELSFHTNATGTANVLRNMRPDTVLIYASTKDVYGANADHYSEVPESCPTEYSGQSALEWSKLIGEKYVEFYARRQNVRACIFRLSTVFARPSEGNEYGFVTHYVESVKNRQPIHLPLAGNLTRDILHVEDFSKACQSFIESDQGFGLYNLGGGRKNSATLLELVNKIGTLIEIEPAIIFDDKYHPVPVNYVSDISLAQQRLGWSPTIKIDDGLRSIF
jgi:nucleoside-diphosphate-sugar epimerase